MSFNRALETPPKGMRTTRMIDHGAFSPEAETNSLAALAAATAGVARG